MAQDKHDFTPPAFPSMPVCAKCGVAKAAVLGGIEVVKGERRRFNGWASFKCEGKAPDGPR